jgi:anaerobic magnesium-protoporphyrin IX monomethyl ester cyclase
MRVALVGAGLDENLGLLYMASALELRRHQAEIVPFNAEQDTRRAVAQVLAFAPEVVGLSMVFTRRAKEFCGFAQALRSAGYRGYLIGGGHFASLNCTRLLADFPAFDCVGLGEGEGLICAIANNPDGMSGLPGLCYRQSDGSIVINPSTGNPDDLDARPFPKRTALRSYFGEPMANVLGSRGCWQDCAFCSINAWYKQGGGKGLRIRSVESVVGEMKELYDLHGVRIFSFQDDNFFLPDREKALRRIEALRDGLQREGVEGIGLCVKARPDSITCDSVRALDASGLLRLFLGVDNASERGLRNLNRRCTIDQTLNALSILDDFDINVLFNLLMFEPDTVLDDILANLRFLERHVEHPLNFCRAEPYAGTGLEAKLVAEGRLIGDYFGFDYRIKDPRAEAFHRIADCAFWDRSFSDSGLHYFSMRLDFYFQIVRRFHPELVTQTLRAAVRNFIKRTNLDTYECLSEIYDFVAAMDPDDQPMIRGFARMMRDSVERRSLRLKAEGERVYGLLADRYEKSLRAKRRRTSGN